MIKDSATTEGWLLNLKFFITPIASFYLPVLQMIIR